MTNGGARAKTRYLSAGNQTPLALLSLLVAGLLGSCSGGSGGSTSGSVSTAIAVTLTPVNAAISTVETQQFTAAAEHGSNSAVTLKVDGITGGNALVGLISADGMYSPPPSAGTHVISATSVEAPSISATVTVTVALLRGVLTYHNDNARTGQNLRETLLTPANVRSATFGKLFSWTVDGYVYAEPLYVANVPIGGHLRNVLFVATQHDSVYAFDADAPLDAPLWHVSFIDAGNGVTTVPYQDTASPAGYAGPGPIVPGGCPDINPEIGITGTPVIDAAAGTLYVVAKTKEVSGGSVAYEYRLHALDITTGSARPGSGRPLRATVPGTTAPNDGHGQVLFRALRENQRAALLLTGNVISIAFGSYCDIAPYQGWVLAVDATTLDAIGAFNAVPNAPAGKGGIWHSGGGPAADGNGNVFVVTGDGPFDADTGGNDYGDSVLKLTNGLLSVVDSFTPYNQLSMAETDTDLASGGSLVLPDQPVGPPHLLLGAGKQGILYLLNRDDLGAFQAGSDSQIVQSLPGEVCGAGTCPIFGSPAYFDNRVFVASVHGHLSAYSLMNGVLASAEHSINTFRWPGATPVISANGTSNGIAWALETNGSGEAAVLHAYAASNVANEIYSSNDNSGRDNPGPAIKFSVPTVADGKVFVGAQFQVSVFGLLN